MFWYLKSFYLLLCILLKTYKIVDIMLMFFDDLCLMQWAYAPVFLLYTDAAINVLLIVGHMWIQGLLIG